MFHSARLKLTAWYVIIIMVVSLAFSLVIYFGVTSDLRTRFEGLQHRLMHPDGDQEMPARMHGLMHDDLKAAQSQVLFILLIANGVILVLSSAAGYFLAGKTLKPIEQTVEEQRRFVTDASHELKTPLTALKTSIEVALRDKELNKEIAIEVLQSSLEETDKLDLLVSELLDLAQHQTAGQKIPFDIVELEEISTHAKNKTALIASKKKIEIKLDLEYLRFDAGEQEIEKLLTILLDNAVKYTPRNGHITLSAKSDGKYALINVQDTGMGIAPQDIPHLFDRFFRADQSRSKNQVEGFGLGLSIAKRIVDSHHGSIDVSSVIGTGTTFTVKLPLRHS